MITVKEVATKIGGVHTIALAWNGAVVTFNPQDPIMMDAYGKYVVAKINFYAEDKPEESTAELELAFRPVIAGEVTA